MLLVTRRDFAPNTMREFIDYAKANEAKLNMAHAGVGSVSYTGCVLLHAALGIKPTMVPFTGSGPAMNALVASQVDYVCDPIAGALGHVRAGSVKPLAIATSKRHPALPDVPTATENGLPGFAAAPFYALFAPKGTPQPIVERLANALSTALDDDAVRKRLIDLGGEIPEADRRGSKPLVELVRSEMTRLAPILKGSQ
jgi:tripartite-type tricarboxylate transporter receptor subunit TctC